MKNKVVVLKIQDVVKKAVFLVIGIIIIAIIISFFTKKNDDTAYNPGTYQASIVLHGKPVELNVTVDDNAIKSVTLSELNQSQAVFYPTFDNYFEDLANSVIEAQSTDIELPQDYAVTGQILLSAVDSALKQAESK